MPNLIQSLHSCDLGHLRIVAGLWGLELNAAQVEAALRELNQAMLDPGLAREIVDSLSEDSRGALQELLQAGGQIPWAVFTRQFGEIREAGPGRRDRERPYLQPISPAEVLFYRAFLARAFFDSSNGPQEFAYIPEDLYQVVTDVFTGRAPLNKNQDKDSSRLEPTGAVGGAVEPLGRLATPRERQQPVAWSDSLLDDATTFLAAVRMEREIPELQVQARVVKELLKAAGIPGWDFSKLESVKSFLEMSRSQALELLGNAWEASESFNELRLLPELACEGEWTNQPVLARRFILHLLDSLPDGKWWSLPAFIGAIKDRHPDFQRPVGDYDSWFIKRNSDGTYLRGFDSWDEVDGALVRFTITRIMFWLGRVDLAMPEEGKPVSAFRMRKKLVSGLENARITVASNGRIRVPRLTRRGTRYLISRFCEWDQAYPDNYNYHVTTRSLKKAGEQGLKVGQLLSLLAKNATAELPPAFVKALKRWEINGTEARTEMQTILRVSRPEVLEELRKSKAGRFLAETLGPVTAIVKPGAQSKVLAALAEMGLLAEAETE